MSEFESNRGSFSSIFGKLKEHMPIIGGPTDIFSQATEQDQSTGETVDYRDDETWRKAAIALDLPLDTPKDPFPKYTTTPEVSLNESHSQNYTKEIVSFAPRHKEIENDGIAAGE